jgi:Peptidase family S41
MKKSTILISVLLLCLIFLAAYKSDRQDQPVLNAKYSATAMQADFNQLLNLIETNHPALYAYTSKEAYQAVVKMQFEKIQDSATVVDFLKILMPLVVKVGCGHSQLWLPQWVWKDSTVGFLPLRLFVKKGRVYIMRNLSADPSIKLSTEVTAINGKPIPELLDMMNSYISTDGNNMSAKKDFLNTSWLSGLLAIALNFPKNYVVDTRLATRDLGQQIKLSAMNLDAYNKLEAWPSNSPKFIIDSTHNTGILTIRTFSFYDSVAGFRHLIDSFFAEVNQQRIQNVILDLRDNSGGDPFCSSYLLAYLEKTPVPYYSEPYERYVELAKPIPMAANHFEGNIYTLINGNCFSSTGHLCALMKYHHIGKFIGSETGGTYTCNDNGAYFSLNKTGIQLRIARNSFSVAVNGIPRFQGISPDFRVDATLEDNIAHNDAVISYAMELIKN